MRSSIVFAAALAVALTAWVPSDAADKASAASSSAKNKEAARVWFEECIVKENIKPLDTILAKGIIMEMTPSHITATSNSNKLTGIDQVKKHIASVNKGGDYTGKDLEYICEGNKVMLYRMVTEKMADGRTATIPWVSIFEFDDAGKINHIRHVHDTLGEKQQLDKSAKAPAKAK